MEEAVTDSIMKSGGNPISGAVSMNYGDGDRGNNLPNFSEYEKENSSDILNHNNFDVKN